MPSLLPGASIGPVFWTSKAFSRIPSPEGTLGRRSHLPAGAPALFLGIIPFGQAGDPRLPCLEGIERDEIGSNRHCERSEEMTTEIKAELITNRKSSEEGKSVVVRLNHGGCL